ncbi:hypothetical protein MRX96_021950 [Rhipicephalus microplus]
MSRRRFPVYQVIDGLKYSKTYLPENVRAIRDYMPQDDDLVLVSYLKCGNNWLEQIIELILHKGESADNYAEFHRWCPYPELTGMRYLHDMQPPRFLKTHFQYQQQLKNPKAKFIYLTRNPLDVCVSFYYYVRSGSVYHFEDGSFDDFVHAFVTAEVERGDYCDHLLSCLYWNKLTEKDQPFIDAAYRFKLASPGMLTGTTIVRKGVVGDWKSHFTQEHLELIREWIAKKNAAGVVRDIWADMDLGGIV